MAELLTPVLFLAVAALCFCAVAYGPRYGRVVGVGPWRGRLMPRRAHEPYHFWVSVSIFAALGGFLTIAVVVALFHIFSFAS